MFSSFSSSDVHSSGADPTEHHVVKPAGRAESPTGQVGVSVPSGAATSPQSAARQKLVAIDVIRSPTVEAVEKTTI